MNARFALLVGLIVFRGVEAPAASDCEVAHVHPAEAADSDGSETNRIYQAQDTLNIGRDDSDDAQVCLEGLKWMAAKFEVTSAAAVDAEFDRMVRFPSPVPSGDPTNDAVAMEWFAVHDQDGRLKTAPAMLVVHESGSRMPVGRLFAQGLRTHGVHAFLIHLPYYGARRGAERRPDAQLFLTTMRQAIADVRRGRDAIAVLPGVEQQHIGLQGTSLGGFVSATAASLDSGFDSVFVMLAGGDLYELIMTGQKDTAKVRRLLTEAGFTDEKLKTLLAWIEPTRVAHRLNPETTWLYSAENDTVVPIKNAVALAEKARLGKQHHARLSGNHYNTIVYFPMILEHMSKQIHRLAGSERSDSSPFQKRHHAPR